VPAITLRRWTGRTGKESVCFLLEMAFFWLAMLSVKDTRLGEVENFLGLPI
jgi:hypothetical protein